MVSGPDERIVPEAGHACEANMLVRRCPAVPILKGTVKFQDVPGILGGRGFMNSAI